MHDETARYTSGKPPLRVSCLLSAYCRDEKWSYPLFVPRRDNHGSSDGVIGHNAVVNILN